MCTTEWFLIELDLSSRSYYAPPTASFQCLPHLGTEAHCPGSVKPQERGCDFKKAFDSIVRTKMLRILQAYGIQHQMVEAIKVMDKNTSALVINRPVPHRHWSASRWSTGSVPIHNLSRLCPDNCHLTIWWNYIEKASKFKTPRGGSFWSRVCGWHCCPGECPQGSWRFASPRCSLLMDQKLERSMTFFLWVVTQKHPTTSTPG